MKPFEKGDIIRLASNPAVESEIIRKVIVSGDHIQLITQPTRIHTNDITTWQPQSKWHCKPADFDTKRIEFLTEEVAGSRKYINFCEEEMSLIKARNEKTKTT